MKTKIRFFDIAMKEETEIDIEDIKTIEKGNECIIIVNNDDFYFETDKIEFI